MHQVGETICHILHLSDGTEIRISPEKAKEWWFQLNATFDQSSPPIYYPLFPPYTPPAGPSYMEPNRIGDTASPPDWMKYKTTTTYTENT